MSLPYSFSSSSSSFRPMQRKLLFTLCLVLLLLLGSCEATRLGVTMKEETKVTTNAENHRSWDKTSFVYKEQLFNFLPKGLVPPSGPSKRHNSLIHSTPLH
ncbi:protein IDA-like [Carica papaya]|uniref:protein IDA-like n=1 Tax=Carica papaya TaxID=3649 RepID=UPI000B8C9826|nr:protein IDA-like [Carica papaya]